MTTPTELLRQAREALAYLLPLAEMQPADVEPGRHLMRGDCPDETQPSGRDAECPACKKMVAAAELIAAIDALPSAPAWPCHCDERGIGKPGVTCGDCPRDYGHTVDSAPSGEPAPTRADLIATLTFYATCGHMNLSDESAWDTVSGEPQNWWCDEAGTATIEDGSLARMALAGDMNADHFAALERGDDVCIDPGTGRAAPQAAPAPQAEPIGYMSPRHRHPGTQGAEMSTGNIESAFPIPHDDSPGAYPAEPGMTLRDYAAIKAMAGMLSGHFSYYGHENYWRRDDIATAAYEMADAMLRARAAKAADGGE